MAKQSPATPSIGLLLPYQHNKGRAALMIEDKSVSRPYREEYRESVKNLIKDLQDKARNIRTSFMPPERVLLQPDDCRMDLKKLLGWPMTETWPADPPKMTIRESKDWDTHRMLRVQFEIFQGFRFYGLLFIPLLGPSPCPMVICQHGGMGTPELCSDLHGNNNYSHIVPALLKKNVLVFAPQMLLWSEEEEDRPCFPGYGLPYNRNETDAQLRQLGGSLAALEVFCLMRALDALLAWPMIKISKTTMIGLSYGGFYTQLAAALDTRIVSAHTSAFFCERESNCWPDFSWKNAAYIMQDAEICGLIAPRKLTIEMGKMDNKFDYRKTEKEFERLRPYYQIYHAEENLKLLIVNTDHKYADADKNISMLLE